MSELHALNWVRNMLLLSSYRVEYAKAVSSRPIYLQYLLRVWCNEFRPLELAATLNLHVFVLLCMRG